MSVKQQDNKKTLFWSLILGGISVVWMFVISFWSQEQFSGWLPEAKSTTAANTDFVFWFIKVWSLIFFVGVVCTMAYFMMKYLRQSDNEKTERVEDNLKFELFWVIFPTLLVIVVFFLGAKDYVKQRVAPPNAYVIDVTAQKWAWTFKYPNGATSTNLVIPSGRPIKMRLTSVDVLHSFFIPKFRIKQDVIPNRYTEVWFQADDNTDTSIPIDVMINQDIHTFNKAQAKYYGVVGTHNSPYKLFCTEFCGDDHSNMNRLVHVVPNEMFNQFLDQANTVDTTAVGGEKYWTANCKSCHSADGAAGTGPTWKGLWGSQRSFSNGPGVVADRAYIEKSVWEPNSQVVTGFPAVMPSFQGQMKPEHVTAVINYMKTLK